MAAEEDDAAALAALASRGDALFAALRDAHPESCVRASLPVAASSSLGDTAAVVRAAAPVALAARRALEALRDAAAAAREDEEEEDARSNSPNPRRPPTVIVELCGPEGGHVVGMLLAATLPPGAASEIVLVDRRWPTKRATTVRSRFEVGSNASDASVARTTSPSSAAAGPFPVAHVDDPALFGGGVPLTRWRAKTTSAGDLRALHASLEATNAAALIVSRRAPGTATLRAAQLFLAPPHTPRIMPRGPIRFLRTTFEPNVEEPPTTSSSTRSRPGSRPAARALVLEPGDPPDKATALRGKTTYRATRDVLGVVAPRPTTSTSGSEERRTELRTVSFTARDVFARGRSAEDATRAWRALCARAAGARSVNDERYIYAATSDGDDRAARAARAFDALAALEPVGGVRTDFEPTSNPPRGVSSSDASGGGAFGPVALGAADQMAEIVARVAALVDVTRPRKGGRRVRSRFEVGSKNAETTVAIEDASRAAAGKKETRRADDAAEEEEDVVLDIFLRRSDPSRWTSGGYAAHHYVAADPQPHAACFEAEVAGARVGFVAIGAYGGDGAEALLPLEDEEEEEEEEAEAGTHASPGGKKERAASDSLLRTPRSTRFLTAAQVDRLCVLPSRRGVGVKEALLRVADAFHALGLPVRLKTASVDATRSLLRCPLLALEGFRDPRTKAGVAKRRGAKIVAVVPRLRSSGIETSSSRDRDAPLLLREEKNIDELRRTAAASPGDDGRANTRVPTKRGGGPFAAVHAAMNRAAPDTVARSAAAMDAAIDGIVRRGGEEEADGGGADDASASESGVSDASESSGVSDARSLVAATIAHRASAEPAFADTHAAIVARLADTRVAREIVRATRLRVRNALDGRRSNEAAREDPTSDPASDPSRGAAFDPLAPGAARFLAAMASRGVAGADRGVADAKTLAANALRDHGVPVRASASSLLPNAAAEAEAPSGARRTPLDPRTVTTERVEPAPVFVAALEIARALAEGGATLADAVPLDVAKALEAMARRSADDDVRRGDGEATTERRGASAVPSRRAAFLAERVLDVLEAERRASGAAGSGVPEVLRSSNRAMTRAEVHAAFVAEGARSVKSDYPRAEKADAYSRKNGNEREAALVSTSRRVVAVEGSAAAVERGMRRGWVFWYAGSPVVRFPDAKPFVFDAGSAAGFHSRERSNADAGPDDDADPRRSRREDGGKRSPAPGPRRRFVPAPVGATWPTEGAVHRV